MNKDSFWQELIDGEGSFITALGWGMGLQLPERIHGHQVMESVNLSTFSYTSFFKQAGPLKNSKLGIRWNVSLIPQFPFYLMQQILVDFFRPPKKSTQPKTNHFQQTQCDVIFSAQAGKKPWNNWGVSCYFGQWSESIFLNEALRDLTGKG